MSQPATTPPLTAPLLEITKGGGRQSKSSYRGDLLPPNAMLGVMQVLKAGHDKYGHLKHSDGGPNWHGIPLEENIGRAITHFMLYLAGDRSETHLINAACRALFAAELEHKANAAEPRSIDLTVDDNDGKGPKVINVAPASPATEIEWQVPHGISQTERGWVRVVNGRIEFTLDETRATVFPSKQAATRWLSQNAAGLSIYAGLEPDPISAKTIQHHEANQGITETQSPAVQHDIGLVVTLERLRQMIIAFECSTTNSAMQKTEAIALVNELIQKHTPQPTLH